MILEDYLQNPYGKGISLLSSEMRSSLDNIYHSLKDGIELKWYTVLNQYLIAHVKIPSRSVKSIKYDVLIEFDLRSVDEGKSTLNRAIARVYSNCPSFTYTFAYAFNMKGDLCPWAKPRYEPEVLVKEPSQRNPYQLTGYERSIYLAAKHILSGGRNNVSRNELISVKTDNFTYILSMVKHQTEIERLYKEGREKQRREELSKTPPKYQTHKPNQPQHHQEKPGVIKTVKTVKTAKNINKTNVTKKTKKI